MLRDYKNTTILDPFLGPDCGKLTRSRVHGVFLANSVCLVSHIKNHRVQKRAGGKGLHGEICAKPIRSHNYWQKQRIIVRIGRFHTT